MDSPPGCQFGLLVLLGVGSGLLTVYLQAWFQGRFDIGMMGRVTSVLMFVASGLLSFSYALAGILVQISLQGMFIAARLLIILVTFGAGMNQAVRKLD